MEPYLIKVPYIGKNPLREDLNKKIRNLCNYQTPRTAREFREAIENSFKLAGTDPRKRFLRNSSYSLFFLDTPLEIIEINWNSRDTFASYYKLDKDSKILDSVVSRSLISLLIPSLKKDILLGRENPFGISPVSVSINSKTYQINYPSSPPFFGGFKFS